jgi:hypothetical protein
MQNMFIKGYLHFLSHLKVVGLEASTNTQNFAFVKITFTGKEPF